MTLKNNVVTNNMIKKEETLWKTLFIFTKKQVQRRML